MNWSSFPNFIALFLSNDEMEFKRKLSSNRHVSPKRGKTGGECHGVGKGEEVISALPYESLHARRALATVERDVVLLFFGEIPAYERSPATAADNAYFHFPKPLFPIY